MRILISNDDGIFAEGIETLAAALLPFGQVYVVAPNRERSASSHSLTLEHPLRAKPVNFPVKVQAAFAVTGTPSDCVKLGISSLLPEPPNLVVTGINAGANASVDVFYSGTVAAAFEGAFNHIPSISFSLASHDPNAEFRFTIPLIRQFVDWAIKNPPIRGNLYNVNFPAIDPAIIKGWKLTRLGSVQYKDSYDLRHDPNGKPYYWLAGEPAVLDPSPDTDIIAIRDGYISVTPIRGELTDFVSLEKIGTNFPLDKIEVTP